VGEPLRVVSFGGGVQTVALAILNAEGRVPEPARVLLMADTGDEMPETYAYLEEHFRPYCAVVGLELVTVRSHAAPSLYAYSFAKRMVPSPMSRYCTEHFKLRVLNRWLRERASKDAPADVQIGISREESHRAKDRKPSPFAVKRWPLLTLDGFGLSRDDCRAVIRAAGLPEPGKSRCWYCPFQGVKGFQRLASEHPDLFEKSLALEANAMARNPRDTLLPDRPLKEAVVAGQLTWDAYLEDEAGCVAGTCFV
jgi:hypothetical protein